MGERIDRVRSLLRGAADRASGAIGQARPVAAVREVLREIRDRRARIPERQLARAVLRAGSVSAASVRTRDGRIEITAELESGRAIRAALVPASASFAARGAKEIVFDVEPPEASDDPKLREIAGMIAAQIARALWGPFLPSTHGEIDGPALVDREGDRLRVDLRTCPAVREAMRTAPAATLVMDALRIERFEVDAHGLSIRIALPQLPTG
jgi:hypothetical protein